MTPARPLHWPRIYRLILAVEAASRVAEAIEPSGPAEGEGFTLPTALCRDGRAARSNEEAPSVSAPEAPATKGRRPKVARGE